MASLNKISLLGRVGNDPDVRYSPQNPDEPIASFSIATGGDKYKDKNGQEQVTETQWHNCTAFKGLGKVVANYVKKGTQIYIEGKMRYEKYTDKNGVEKTAAKVIVDNLILCGSKNENSNNGGATANNFSIPTNNVAQNQTQNFNQPANNFQPDNFGSDSPDTEIPF